MFMADLFCKPIVQPSQHAAPVQSERAEMGAKSTNKVGQFSLPMQSVGGSDQEGSAGAAWCFSRGDEVQAEVETTLQSPHIQWCTTCCSLGSIPATCVMQLVLPIPRDSTLALLVLAPTTEPLGPFSWPA